MQIRVAKYIVAVLLIALAGSCFKKVTTSTELIIKPLLQIKSGGENSSIDGVFAYSYKVKNDSLSVASYEDALQYRATNTVSGEIMESPDAMSMPYMGVDSAKHNYISLPLDYSPSFVVVVDSLHHFYGYCTRKLEAENLPNTFVTLIFHYWKNKPYTEGNIKQGIWNMVPPETPVELPPISSGDEDKEESGDDSQSDNNNNE